MTATQTNPATTPTATDHAPSIGRAGTQVFWMLRLGFTVAPILFGLDKLFNWMVEWPSYLAPWINDLMPGTAQEFMFVVGGVEILGGLLVALAPRIGAPIVAAWLTAIVVNLVTFDPPEYYDIALRDVGLVFGALALTRLAWARPRGRGSPPRR